MPDNGHYEEDPSHLTSELTTLSSLSGRGGSLSDIPRVSVKVLCRRFGILIKKAQAKSSQYNNF